MGLKQWIAKNVARPGAYGETMGRAAVVSGFSFGGALYAGSGIGSDQSASHVVTTREAMIVGGYVISCPDPHPNPPVEDSSKLSALTAAAGIAFATSVAMVAAENLFELPENRSRFHSAITSAVSRALMERSRESSPQLPNFLRPVRRLKSSVSTASFPLFSSSLRLTVSEPDSTKTDNLGTPMDFNSSSDAARDSIFPDGPTAEVGVSPWPAQSPSDQRYGASFGYWVQVISSKPH